VVTQWPYLVPLDDGGVAAVCQAYASIWFDLVGSDYVPRYGALYGLVHDTSAQVFRLLFPNGEMMEFYDFDQTDHPPGIFKSFTTIGGQVLSVTSYARTSPAEVQRTLGSTIESFLYAHNAHNQLTSVTLRRKVGSGSWTSIRRVVYAYYGTGSSDGLHGDLKTAELQQLSGTTWQTLTTRYYRYYIDTAGGKGFAHGLKFVLDPEAFRRLSADPSVSDPFTASDATVAQYADYYFEYDSQRRVTKEITEAGTRTTTFSYTSSSEGSSSAGEIDFNQWIRRTVETRPDGSQVIVFTNGIGAVLLRSLQSGSDQWNTFQQFDDQGRLVLGATAAAVSSYSYDSTSLTVNLRSAAGLILLYEYYTSTDLSSGAVAGYLKAEKIRQGTSTSPITLRVYQYSSSPTVDGHTYYPFSQRTDYADEAGLVPIVTQWAYTFYSGTLQIQQRTTTLPAISTGQNGSGVSAVKRELFDQSNNLIATQDERGYITTSVYDSVLGVMTEQVQDDDPPSGSGWTANAGTRLKLTSDYQYDSLARQTQSLGPAHDINGVSVRTAHWTVYKDTNYQIYDGQGFATGTGPGYTYTLINPVVLTFLDTQERTTDSIQAIRSSTSGPLTASDGFPQSTWCRWTHTIYNDQGQLSAVQVYHTIPSSGSGSPGTNYDETDYGYSALDQQNRAVNPAGTITRSVYDERDLLLQIFIGTNDTGATDSDPTGGGASGNNMKLVVQNQYDGGSAGGNGNLTQITQPVDDTSGHDRITSYLYDWRDRQTDIDGEVDFYQISTYDNLDRVTRLDRRNTTATGGLIGRSEASYDDLNRVYQTKRYAVNPNTGAIGNALVDNTWYDAAGNVIKRLSDGSQLFTKTIYDSVGRATATYQGYYTGSGTEPYSQVGTITSSNKIFEQTFTTFDEASNVTFVSSYQRFHNATGNGALNSPSTDPKARISYQARWYDEIGRNIAAANYGTNNNAGSPTRPDTAPASSDTVLVSTTTSNDRGEVYQTVTPADALTTGMVTTNTYDDASRLIQTVQDDGGLEITTQWTYATGSQIQTITVLNSDTGDQTTTYTYGVTLSGSAIASNDLLASVQYPDAVDSADLVSYHYNRQGDRIQMTDQNGTVHQYDYDLLGRLTQDRVTTLGTLGSASIDGTVRRIGRTYEVRGKLQKLTSYNNATVGSGSVVSDVQLNYNNFLQLSNDYQSHSGAVNTSTTPQVQYGYADGSANTVRRVSVNYPAGGDLTYLYGTSVSDGDRLSRVAQIDLDSFGVAAYTYAGLANFVIADYLSPAVRWNLATGSGTNPYTGLDRFGRLIDCRWQRYSGTVVDLARWEHGYDRASNRLWRQDDVARGLSKTFDELYEYDTVNRLTEIQRGTLNSGHTGITSQTLEQNWTLDTTGNWKEFDIDLPGTTNDLNQQRTHNGANEISNISRTLGANWPTPAYDRAGNTTGFPQPAALTASYTGVYDAWNRIVQLKSGTFTVATLAYDGVNRRLTSTTGSVTRHYYYSDSWQVLEERMGTSTSADQQFAWGLRHVDDLILRDQFSGGSGSSASSSSGVPKRLHALQDANWNVAALVDATGTVVQRVAYTAYGVPAFLDASFNAGSNSNNWETLFTGQRYDSSTGLYLYRNRFYHANLGRFLSRDPIEYSADDPNLYNYVGNSPTNEVDPTGLIGSMSHAPPKPLPPLPPGYGRWWYPGPGTPHWIVVPPGANPVDKHPNYPRKCPDPNCLKACDDQYNNCVFWWCQACVYACLGAKTIFLRALCFTPCCAAQRYICKLEQDQCKANC
jgi:RHS repeat-associated protein